MTLCTAIYPAVLSSLHAEVVLRTYEQIVGLAEAVQRIPQLAAETDSLTVDIDCQCCSQFEDESVPADSHYDGRECESKWEQSRLAVRLFKDSTPLINPKSIQIERSCASALAVLAKMIGTQRTRFLGVTWCIPQAFTDPHMQRGTSVILYRLRHQLLRLELRAAREGDLMKLYQHQLPALSSLTELACNLAHLVANPAMLAPSLMSLILSTSSTDAYLGFVAEPPAEDLDVAKFLPQSITRILLLVGPGNILHGTAVLCEMLAKALRDPSCCPNLRIVEGGRAFARCTASALPAVCHARGILFMTHGRACPSVKQEEVSELH